MRLAKHRVSPFQRVLWGVSSLTASYSRSVTSHQVFVRYPRIFPHLSRIAPCLEGMQSRSARAGKALLRAGQRRSLRLSDRLNRSGM